MVRFCFLQPVSFIIWRACGNAFCRAQKIPTLYENSHGAFKCKNPALWHGRQHILMPKNKNRANALVSCYFLLSFFQISVCSYYVSFSFLCFFFCFSNPNKTFALWFVFCFLWPLENKHQNCQAPRNS